MIFVVDATGRRVCACFAQSTWPVSASTRIADAAGLRSDVLKARSLHLTGVT